METIVFFWKALAQKVTWIFSKIHALKGFNRKTYKIGHPIFFMNTFKVFQRLVAWLVCLNELQWFASRFFLPTFVKWRTFWWFIYQFLCLPNSVWVFLQYYWTGMGFQPTHAEHIEYHFNALNSRAASKIRGQSMVKWIEQIKIKAKLLRFKQNTSFQNINTKKTYQIKPMIEQK